MKIMQKFITTNMDASPAYCHYLIKTMTNMKNNFLFCLSLLLLLISCNSENQNNNSSNDIDTGIDTLKSSTSMFNPALETPQPHDVENTPEDYEHLLGYYVGQFKASGKVKTDGTYANKITISINKMTPDSVFGHSVVAGNKRPFKGTFDKNKLVITAKEPGDDKYDGTFEFVINDAGQSLNGDWTANDSKLKVTERVYNLSRQDFYYNKNLMLPKSIEWAELYNKVNTDYEYEALTPDVTTVNPSTEKLTKAQVENLYKGDLEVIRNSIYARHGYSFKNRKMRYVFDNIDWYMPVSTDVRSKLTALEKQNIELIKRYENHADTYYDAYGR